MGRILFRALIFILAVSAAGIAMAAEQTPAAKSIDAPLKKENVSRIRNEQEKLSEKIQRLDAVNKLRIEGLNKRISDQNERISDQNSSAEKTNNIITVFGIFVAIALAIFGVATFFSARIQAKKAVEKWVNDHSEEVMARVEKRLVQEAGAKIDKHVGKAKKEIDDLVKSAREGKAGIDKILNQAQNRLTTPGKTTIPEGDKREISRAAQDAMAKPDSDKTLQDWELLAVDAFFGGNFEESVNALEKIYQSEDASPRRKASALVSKGIALGKLDRPENEIAVYDEVVSRYGDDEDGAFKKMVAGALFNKGIALGNLDRPEDEIAVYDEVVSRYGDEEDKAFKEPVVMALVNKGITLGKLDRPEDVIAVCDEVLSRYGDEEDKALKELVAKALFNKGIALGKLDRPEDEIAVCDEVVSRYGDEEDKALKEPVVMALVSKGITLGELDRPEDAIAVYDEVISRYGDEEDGALKKQVAKAFVNKGAALGKLDRPKDAIAVYDEVISRYGDEEDKVLKEWVAMTLVNKGIILGQAGK